MSFSHLSYLETSGLIKLYQVQPELEYIFRHTLFDDVVYDSLLKTDRRTLHRIVGEILEELELDNLDELAPRLGWHFFEAGDYPQAQMYYARAGDLAASKYANQEAALHYGNALEIAKKRYSTKKDSQPISDLFIKLGRSLEQQGKYEEGTKLYEEITSFAEEYGEKQLELDALIAHMIAHSVPSPTFNPVEGISIAERALKIAESLDNPAAEAKIYWALLLSHSFHHQHESALKFGEKSLEIAREHGLKEQIAYTLSDLANFAYILRGEYKKGLSALDEALVLWKELNNLPLLANALSQSGFLLIMAGDPNAAFAKADEAYQLSLSISNLWGQSFSLGIKGYASFELGKTDDALPYLEEAVQLGQEGGFEAIYPIAFEIQAILYEFCGDIERGYECANKSLAYAEERIQFWLPQALACLAYLYSVDGNLDLAEKVIQRLNKVRPGDRRLSYTSPETLADIVYLYQQKDYQAVIEFADDFLAYSKIVKRSRIFPFIYYYKGLALLSRSQVNEAVIQLTMASKEAKIVSSPWWYWRSMAALTEIEAVRGNESQAETYRRQVLRAVQYIASHAVKTNLKKSFLNQPKIQKLLRD